MPKVAFLISQPRSGSTMLQHILGGHLDIETLEEPWILLPLLYPINHNDITAGYGAHIAMEEHRRFFGTLSQKTGNDVAKNCVRAFAQAAYETACQNSGASLFLDKTPRYYLIINEILDTFPESKVILLVRNPLAVFVSIMISWVKHILLKLQYFSMDILSGSIAIADACRRYGKDKRVFVLKFEEFVVEPERFVDLLLRHLELKVERTIVNYGSRSIPEFGLGDHRSVYKFDRPNPQLADRWLNNLSDPQLWRLTNDYASMCDPTVFETLGYDLSECVVSLSKHRPSSLKLATTIPLRWLMRTNGPSLFPVRDLLIRGRCKVLSHKLE